MNIDKNATKKEYVNNRNNKPAILSYLNISGNAPEFSTMNDYSIIYHAWQMNGSYRIGVITQ
jgi:hypothetical protein